MKSECRAEHNQKKRLVWVKSYRNTENSYCEKVIWSDESIFSLFGTNGIVRVWQSFNEEFKSV